MKNMIEVEKLSFEYSDKTSALNQISFQVADGEKVALIGPNGAGKSTLLKHLNGILRGNGKIVISDTLLSDATLREIRKKVGLIFQNPNDQLFCPTVFDDVAFGPMHFGYDEDKIDAIVKRTLSEVGMQGCENRPSHHLSLGEKRRVTIAAVLACEPLLLALDEPAAMLDPKRRRWLIDFIKNEKRSVILATHDLEMASETCSRIIVMKAGRIVADAPTINILSDFSLLEKCDLEPIRTV